jgi:hypothetical protein
MRGQAAEQKMGFLQVRINLIVSAYNTPAAYEVASDAES